MTSLSNNLRMSFKTAFQRLHPCNAVCAKCTQKEYAQLTYVPLGQQSQEASYMAALFASNASICYTRDKEQEEKENCTVPLNIGRKKIRAAILQTAERITGSAHEAKIAISDLAGNNQKQANTLNQLQQNVEHT